jgi:serine/threonine protein kinase
MTLQAEPCSDDSLRLLLSGDEASDEYRLAAEHVETCPVCQARLATLAADAEWWNEASSLLDDDLALRWEPDTSDPSLFPSAAPRERESVDDAVRQLIGAPRHPELLGRLGRYDVERVIGSGGMGIVLKAHDSELNRPVAIKLLAAHLAHVGAARERFAREGRAAAAVVHEHVVAIYNVESDDKTPFLVMQYVPGRSLQARVDEDGPLGTEEILRIGMQAAAGLAAAHRQGLVHRDIKPSNILLEDTVERAVLTDFGLARAFDDASLTQTGLLAGTPHYMSPEQALGRSVDHRSDLFSLGAVLYFMATGHPPFRAAGPLAVLHRICQDEHRPVWQSNPNIPDELSDVIDRLLEKKPSKRFANAEEVQEKLASLLSRWQRQGLGRRRSRRWRTRHLRRLVAGLAALVLTAWVVVVAVWLTSPWQAEQSPPASPASIEARLAPIAEEYNQFETELANVEHVLTGNPPETFYLQDDDSWARELKALEQDVTQMELMSH